MTHFGKNSGEGCFSWRRKIKNREWNYRFILSVYSLYVYFIYLKKNISVISVLKKL